jgi:hypothetical protein
MRPSALDDNSYCTSVLQNLSTLSDFIVIKVKNLSEKICYTSLLLTVSKQRCLDLFTEICTIFKFKRILIV